MQLKRLLRDKIFGQANIPEITKRICPEPIAFYDVGAAAGLQRDWDRFRFIGHFFMFEPHSESFSRLSQMYKGYSNIRIFDTPLSDLNGTKTLSKTNVPTGSTILEFNQNSEGMHYIDHDYLYPITKVDLPTLRLDKLIPDNTLPSPDLIKLDTQGSESVILQGLGPLLDDAIAIETELAVLSIYENQQPYYEVLQWLNSKGFEAFDIRGMGKGYPNKNLARKYFDLDTTPNSKKNTIAARLGEFDVILFKSPKALLASKNQIKIRKCIIAYCIYGFYANALDLIERACSSNVIPVSESDDMKHYVVQLRDAMQSHDKIKKIKSLIGR